MGGMTGAASGGPSEWVDEYGDYLFRFALGRVRNEALAQDLVQETFLAGIKAWSRFSARASVRTWLTGILKNKIIDHYRRSGREPLLGDLAAMSDGMERSFDEDGHWLTDRVTAPGHWTEDVVAQADREGFWKAFRACSDKLPEQVRRVFVLREVDGEESDVICRLLKITSQNYWTIMHRARHALRRCLETNYFGVGGGNA